MYYHCCCCHCCLYKFGIDPWIRREIGKHLSCNSRAQRINFLSVRMNQASHPCNPSNVGIGKGKICFRTIKDDISLQICIAMFKRTQTERIAQFHGLLERDEHAMLHSLARFMHVILQFGPMFFASYKNAFKCIFVVGLPRKNNVSI